jgi:hypothetical protein
MRRAPEKRSPAPRGNAENRAEVVHNRTSCTMSATEPGANFAGIYISRRYGIALSLAWTIAALASLGRAFG